MCPFEWFLEWENGSGLTRVKRIYPALPNARMHHSGNHGVNIKHTVLNSSPSHSPSNGHRSHASQWSHQVLTSKRTSVTGTLAYYSRDYAKPVDWNRTNSRFVWHWRAVPWEIRVICSASWTAGKTDSEGGRRRRSVAFVLSSQFCS